MIGRRMKDPFGVGLAWLCLVFVAGAAWSSDWPMYRHDAQRSGSTEMELQLPLHLQWSIKRPKLTPAWPSGGIRCGKYLRFDEFYQPIVGGKQLFLASSLDDTCRAFDVETGKQNWVFHTGGPIRFAPVWWKGKVYVVSDGGSLCCLNDRDGSLAWVFNKFPNDRKVLGNERLISAFPARGGPVIVNDVLYFGRGLWPSEGTFIYAVNPETGQVIWENDSVSNKLNPAPHHTIDRIGVSPQGYLLVGDNRLLVPCGRALPAIFDMETGKLLYNRSHVPGKRKEADFRNCTVGKYLVNNVRLNRYSVEPPPAALASIGAHPIISKELILILGLYPKSSQSIIAFDSTGIKREEYLDTRKRKRHRYVIPKAWTKRFPHRGSEIQCKAGKLLFIRKSNRRKNNQLTAIDLTATAKDNFAVVAWQTEVAAPISSVIAAAGRLFVVTGEGHLYCYGAKKTETPKAWPPVGETMLTDQLDGSSEVASLVKAAGKDEGYALVLGLKDGKRVESLLKNTKFLVVAVDKDKTRTLALRKKLTALGLYGRRVSVHVGDPLRFRFPPYIADMITSEDVTRIRAILEPGVMSRLFDSLRPYGGSLCLSQTQEDHDALKSVVLKSNLENPDLQFVAGYSVLKRKGKLVGAGSWSFVSADVNQTSQSDDRRARGPLGVLWYSGKGFMGGGGRATSRPRVRGGRVFSITPSPHRRDKSSFLKAYDVYTGRIMWRRKMPFAFHFLQEKRSEHVVLEDGMYFNFGQFIWCFDPATGELKHKWPIPTEVEPGSEQGYLAIAGDVLVTDPGMHLPKRERFEVNEVFCRELVAMNRKTGKKLWSYKPRKHVPYYKPGSRRYEVSFPMNIVNGKVLLQEVVAEAKGEKTAEAVALDLKTGRVIWRQPLKKLTQAKKAQTLAYMKVLADKDLVVFRHAHSRYRTGQFHINVPGIQGQDGWEMIFKVSDGSPVAFKEKRPMIRDPLTGNDFPLKIPMNYGCGPPLASENLIVMRTGSAGYFDRTVNSGTVNLGAMRPLCQINMLIADGVVSIPGPSGCLCNYSMSPSLTLVRTPEADMWGTHNYFPECQWPDDVKRVGLNFGAPGDRVDESQTCWLNVYSGEALERGHNKYEVKIPIEIEPKEVTSFRHHPLSYQGKGLKWVAASGVEGIRSIRFKLNNKPKEGSLYRVTLVFAEPKPIKPGTRVFDVALQGKDVLKGFDIVKESGGPRRVVTREFPGVAIKDALEVKLTPAPTARNQGPLICGMSMRIEKERIDTGSDSRRSRGSAKITRAEMMKVSPSKIGVQP